MPLLLVLRIAVVVPPCSVPACSAVVPAVFVVSTVVVPGVLFPVAVAFSNEAARLRNASPSLQNIEQRTSAMIPRRRPWWQMLPPLLSSSW